MEYNFDKVINRKGTDSKKWNNLEEEYGSEDLLPMWVADMDFESPKEIIDAFQERVKHGIFGYPDIGEDVYNSIIKWVKERYNWDIKKEWILFTPGVVTGLNIGINEIGEEGDNVVVQTPVYPPFYRVLENNNRELNSNPLKFNGEKFEIDFDNLEKNINSKTNIMMLCNPHNPVGRAWNREELTKLGDLAIENDLTIISDDIHGDLTLDGVDHIPMASISKELEERTVTFISPSKTFNVAGLFTSVAIIPNSKLRDTFDSAIERMEIGKVSIFGALGLKTAYENGGDWLDAALEYIEANMDYAIDYIESEMPELKVTKPDATYLLWIDFRELNRSADEVMDALLEVGEIILNDGRPYGEGGEGYFRLNVGCPRSTVEEGLKRIKKAVESLK